jgi:diguanylate cyclase (GGDEF)-like protein
MVTDGMFLRVCLAGKSLGVVWCSILPVTTAKWKDAEIPTGGTRVSLDSKKIELRGCSLSCEGKRASSLKIVPETMLLRHLASESYLGPCVFVTNATGEIIGLVFWEELNRRLNLGHPRERERWANTPLSALLTTRLPSPSVAQRHTPPKQTNPTAIYHQERLLGVVTEEDVLLSWQLLGPALSAASIDPLTSLVNRATYERRLLEEWNRSLRLNQSVAVIICDIDCFKKLNDTFGHQFGDQVIKNVAYTLEKSLRSYDLVSRFGGDEFICLMIGLRPKDIVIPIKRMQARLRQMTWPHNPNCPDVTISMGAAVCHAGFDEYEPQSLIEAADRCLYRAKAEGSGLSFYTETLSAEGLDQAMLAVDCSPAAIGAYEEIPEEVLAVG